LAEVNTAVNQMDQVVQQNAAMVEQSTAATHSLKAEAGELARLIARFTVSGGQTALGQPGPRGAARQAPRPASPRSRPAPSPARALGRKVAASFGASAPSSSDDWEEF
jgi:methyl-accepting chemotaxis protein